MIHDYVVRRVPDPDPEPDPVGTAPGCKSRGWDNRRTERDSEESMGDEVSVRVTAEWGNPASI